MEVLRRADGGFMVRVHVGASRERAPKFPAQLNDTANPYHQTHYLLPRAHNFHQPPGHRDMSESQEDMKIDPARAQALISHLGAIRDRVAAVAGSRTVGIDSTQ